MLARIQRLNFAQDMFLSSCSAFYSNATALVNSLATDKQCYRYAMNIDRKLLIREIIQTRFEGNQAAFARAIKKSPNQVNQWLTGYRSVGDGAARNIENMLKLGNLWMDGKEPAAQSAAAPPGQPVRDPILDDLDVLEPDDADVFRNQLAEVEARLARIKSEIRAAANKARKRDYSDHREVDSKKGKRAA